MPCRSLFACRGAASTTTLRSEYRAHGPCTTTTSWVVEAIRASSPARSPAISEHAAWKRRHPSALESFEQIPAVAEWKRVVVFTNRCFEKVYGFVGISELYYAGSNDMDIKGPTYNKEDTKTAVLL